MKKLLVLVIFFAATVAGGQILQNILQPSPIVNLGETNVSANANNQNGVQYFTEFRTGATTYNVLSCSIGIAAHGTAGKHAQCGLYTVNGTTPGTVICHGEYTETGTEPGGYLMIPLDGCGTLAASTDYFEFSNLDDSALPYDYYNCGGSCSGTYPSASASTVYTVQAYGTYSTNPSVTAAGLRLTHFVSLQ